VPHNDAAILGEKFYINWHGSKQSILAIIRVLHLSEDRLLEWPVEDGWEPLWKSLGKAVPSQDFPNGNPAKVWAGRNAKTLEGHHRRATMKMLLVITLVIISLVATMAMLRTWRSELEDQSIRNWSRTRGCHLGFNALWHSWGWFYESIEIHQTKLF
jgi:hypothetical protein